MKTVTGKVVSTKPISLSTAAKHLSRFTALDNTASNAVRVYLKRASDAFNSLVQFHQELKGPTSHPKRKASKPLDSDVKIETLVAVDENPHGENIKNLEKKGKRKKNREFELNNDGPLKIEQNVDGVRGVEVEKSVESKGKNEEMVKIERSTDGVAQKRKKKKHGKDKLKNEVSMTIERGAEEGNEVMKGLDEGRNITQQESKEVDQDMGEIDGGRAKRKDKKTKKKKKKREKILGEERFGDETGKKRKSGEVEGGETNESAEMSGKKKRKRRKTEGGGEL